MSRDSRGRFIKGEKPVSHIAGCDCFRCTGIVWNKGLSWSEDMKDKMSKSHLGKKYPQTQGEKNWNWKGDKVGYIALHSYISKKKIKTDICQKCDEKRKTVWANKSYQYKRDLSDWIELCHSCHMARDAKSGWGIALKKFPDLKRYYNKRNNEKRIC